MDKMRYLLSLFVYTLKMESHIPINTLFRYVYIYSVSLDYITNAERQEGEVVIDKDMGMGDYSILYDAVQRLNESKLVTFLDSQNIVATDKLYVFVENLLSQERVREDLNRITYFVGVISNYSEDVILSIFFNEPNVVEATNRNLSVVDLKNNRLYELLLEFEKIANNDCGKDLDKYDVFTTWLEYIFEKYVQGKSKNG